ncbi:transposable element Tc1 transposase [Trichonephila clavipes]|nr:transposable element Tc1 transposase [Trichonephila clavipes]
MQLLFPYVILYEEHHENKFVEQISVFERGRIVGLREAGLSYRAVAARVQRNSLRTIMRVSKQWTDEGRTVVSGNVTSAREDRRLVRMAQTDRTAFSITTGSTVVNSYTCFIVLHQFGDVCCSVGCPQGFLYTRKTIAACDCTGPMCKLAC